MTTRVLAAIAASVEGSEASAVIKSQDWAAAGSVSRTAQQPLRRPARQGDPRIPGRGGEVLGGQRADEPGRAVKDDVVLAIAHAIRRYPSVSGSSVSCPST